MGLTDRIERYNGAGAATPNFFAPEEANIVEAVSEFGQPFTVRAFPDTSLKIDTDQCFVDSDGNVKLVLVCAKDGAGFLTCTPDELRACYR